MKIVQTLWTDSAEAREKGMDIKGGWSSSEYYWMSWALSCLQARKFYDDLELVTGETGKKILVDLLELPYTKVSVALDTVMDPYPKECWSLAKLFSFNMQEEPFLHIDGDLFLWQPFEDTVLHAGIVAQNMEVNLGYYKNTLEALKKESAFLPPVLADINTEQDVIYAANTGIFGGTNLPAIYSYCGSAFDFVNRNLDLLHKLDKHLPNFNFVFEQCLLYYTMEAQNIPIRYVMSEAVDHPGYSGYVKFTDIPKTKLIHPVGGYKKMDFLCNNLARRLRREYPDVYYKIINLYKDKSIALSSRIYSQKHFLFTGTFPFINQQEDISATGINSTPGQDFTDKSYRRTLAALTLSSRQPAAFNKMQDLADCHRYLTGLISEADDSHRRDITELLTIEHTKTQLAQSFKDNNSLLSFYQRDVSGFGNTDALFAQHREDILSAAVTINKDIVLIELEKNWEYNPDTDVPETVVADVFSSEPALHQVALVPDILLMQVDEIYLETLDMMVVDAAREETTIAGILQTVSQYFEEDQSDPEGERREQLILDVIKRLLYRRVLALE